MDAQVILIGVVGNLGHACDFLGALDVGMLIGRLVGGVGVEESIVLDKGFGFADISQV